MSNDVKNNKGLKINETGHLFTILLIDTDPSINGKTATLVANLVSVQFNSVSVQFPFSSVSVQFSSVSTSL